MNFYANISNTCHDCGQPCDGVWAPNRDAARAGGGKCAECAGVEKPKKVEVAGDEKPVRKRARTSKQE